MNSHLIKKELRIIIDPVYSDRLSDILDFFRKEEDKMQNKNTIKNWKIEITDEGAKLIITEGAVMARDVLNLAREQAIKYNLSVLKIYMHDGQYYDYTFENDMLYFTHMTEKINNGDIPYLMKRAAEKLSTLKLNDRIWSVNFSIDNLQKKESERMATYMLPALWSFIFMIEMMIMNLLHYGIILTYHQDNGNLLKM